MKAALHLVHSNCFYQKIILDIYISSSRGRATPKKIKTGLIGKIEGFSETHMTSH